MRRAWLAALSITAVVFSLTGGIGTAAGEGNLTAAINGNRVRAGMVRLPNGTFLPVGRERAAGSQATSSAASVAGCTNTFTRAGFPDNVRVNTDCGGAGQQEEWVAVNPTDPRNVVVSQTGAFTGVHYSLRGGAPGSFGDSSIFTELVPCDPSNLACGPGGLWSYDLFTDPAHAFDPKGNLYFTAIGYDFLQDPVNGVYLWKGNACGRGQALGNPSDPSCVQTDGIPGVIHDNFAHPDNQDATPWIAAGPRSDAPRKSQVAAVWTTTRFGCAPTGADFCDQPVFFSGSIDGGVIWSKARNISGRAPFCVGGDAATGDPTDAHACNLNEAPQDLIAPDGTIYLVWLNYNTTSLVNQNLFRSSTDRGKTWSKVHRVGGVATLEPWSVPGHEIPDCTLFYRCLPPTGWRVPNHPSLTRNSATGELAVTWADFRNGGPCRTDRATGLPVAPCANYNEDAFVSTSTDGGAHWSAPTLASGASGVTAQWQAAGTAGPRSGDLFVSYYDRGYGNCERTGCNDITLATSHDDGKHWRYRRITTRSMPYLTCAENFQECSLLGDYQGLAFSDGKVLLTWADTRGRGFNAPEQDIYFAKVRAS